MAISKVASHCLLCCVPTLYVHMSKCCFINVTSKHEERLIFDRLSVRVFLRLLNPDNPYCTIPVSSFMMNADSHIHIIFPIIRRCPRKNVGSDYPLCCIVSLIVDTLQTSLKTPNMPLCKECKHSPSHWSIHDTVNL